MRCSRPIVALSLAWGTGVLGLGTSPAVAQHGHGERGRHAVAEGVELTVRDDPDDRVLTVRLGPLHLPAGSDHMTVAQAPDAYLSIPFDGWLIAYHPRLTDAAGETIPGRLLHHVAFWNSSRSDFLCPNKEEHIFGAGGEMNDWPALPEVGYRVAEGDRIRVNTMFHNPTERDYPEMYLEVKVEYRRAQEASLTSVYPAWFDVQECGPSDYDLEAGENVTVGEVALRYSGLLLGVGGHMHDYGRGLLLENASRGEEIARLTTETDAAGRLLSMPIVSFVEQGGYVLASGDVLRVTARYDNPTGRRLTDGAMGIVVGYFVPAEEARMAELRRDRE